jgi:small subunit ribosomal protein S8
MSVSDPIGDMLTRLRNGSLARLASVDIPHSNLKAALAKILKAEGFVADYTAEGGGAKKTLRVYLRYAGPRGRDPVIRGLTRVSRPGLRRYAARDAIPRIRNGTGVAVLSTSRGVLTDAEARAAGVGGEWLCSVW